MNKLLKKIYTNVESPAGYSSPEKLYLEARKKDKKVTRANVAKFLENERSYTLQRRGVRKFKRLKYRPVGYMCEFQADLAIMDAPNVRAENDNIPYFLVVVDLLSRALFCTFAVSKSSDHMIEAFERIFKQTKYVCWSLQTDDRGSLRWIDDVLPKVTRSLNLTTNAKTGVPPASVNFSNAESIRKRLWDEDNSAAKAKFTVGMKVRTLNYKQVFDTGYFPKFSDTIRKIHIVEHQKRPVTYRLIEDDGKVLKKQFYASELCKVQQDAESVYRIEIIKERTNKKGEKEYFIHYLGYDESRWVNQSEMVNI